MSARATAHDEPGEDPRLTLRALHRASLETGAYWPTASGLVFLLFVIIPAWQTHPAGQAAIITVLALVFGAQYLYSTGMRSYPLRSRLGWLAGIWGVLMVLGVFLGQDILYMVMFVVVMHAVVLPWRAGRVAVVVIGLGGLAASIVIGEQFAMFLAIAGMVLALFLGFGIQKGVLEDELERAEQRSAVLAVAAERERIGRDLHDILGHSLTTITVSAQLARRLADVDVTAAKDQLAEIERISRQALADVRATASGMQQVRAATEIASARSVLAAAGIEAEVPSSLPAVPEDRAELLGYVVREGITNVVRHSRATRCRIVLDGDALSVIDDGVGIRAGSGRTGLAGLERRVAAAGGELVVADGEPGPAGAGTRITVSFPAADRSGSRAVDGVGAGRTSRPQWVTR